MQYDKSDGLLSGALSVIAQYDPDLYARMQADDWLVSGDYGEAFADEEFDIQQWYSAMHAFGTTSSAPGTSVGYAEVYINAEAISEWAEENGVPAVYFAADVLAHEFTHTHQPAAFSPDLEPPAFRAGSAFASKLPARYGEPIKALSDGTLSIYVRSL